MVQKHHKKHWKGISRYSYELARTMEALGVGLRVRDTSDARIGGHVSVVPHIMEKINLACYFQPLVSLFLMSCYFAVLFTCDIIPCYRPLTLVVTSLHRPHGSIPANQYIAHSSAGQYLQHLHAPAPVQASLTALDYRSQYRQLYSTTVRCHPEANWS
jgi:hypothetical protein